MQMAIAGIDNLAYIFFCWCWCCWLSFRYTQRAAGGRRRKKRKTGAERRILFQNMIYGLCTIIGYQAPLLEFRTPPLCINSARTDVFRLIFNSTRSTSLSFKLRLRVLPNPCT